MRTPLKLLVGGAVLLTAVGGGLGVANVALDDTKVNAYAMNGPIREIVVKSDSGNVDLVPAGSRVRVRETQHYVSQKPTLDRKLAGGVLTLDSLCGSAL